ncbi:MAG TPA: hypothetical protein VGQ21_11100, partial [Thermoanaerobaculia bacterium]|nr:hypothetical protein [Thermoanaerobaculia bacterium]
MIPIEPREQVMEPRFEPIEVSVHLWLDGGRDFVAHNLRFRSSSTVSIGSVSRFQRGDPVVENHDLLPDFDELRL